MKRALTALVTLLCTLCSSNLVTATPMCLGGAVDMPRSYNEAVAPIESSICLVDTITPAITDSIAVAEQSTEHIESLQEISTQSEPTSRAVAQGKLVTLPRKRVVSSTKAVLCSIIPGGGQIYNRQYWKLPIIVGAYTACYYAINWNNANLQEYATAFRDVKSKTPLDYDSWKEFLPYNAKPEDYVNNTGFHDQLRRGRDFYRRYRDMSIIVSVAVYALVMIDSYVDAELYNFDISPNLSLSYSPTVMPASSTQMHSGYGVHVALTF